jgi:Tol biopolymer transport system component/DNA-binding winged helix-turn-helix (wHTH) protein
MMRGKSFVFRFADVEVREREFRLTKAGEVLPVEPKAFRVLLFLLRNPQKLITKEELLDAVWSDAAVSENSLARAIALLRRQLGDDIHEPRYIATVPTVGYRFLSPVEVSEDVFGNLEEPGKAGEADIRIGRESGSTVVANITPAAGAGTKNEIVPDPKPRRTHAWKLAAVFLVLLGIPAAVWYLYRPRPVPRIVEYAPITHDGHRKWLIGTDGSRLFFNQLESGTVAQVAVSGGEIAQIPITLPNPEVFGVSPDGTTLFIVSGADGGLWSVGSLGGALRRVTTSETASVDWSPDGKNVVYTTTDGGVYLARSDGANARKLASVKGFVRDISWSPDGSKLRFTEDNALWEMSSTGSNLHRLLQEWPAGHCCGRWTPDGRFFVFLSGIRKVIGTTAFLGSQIWIIDERHGLIRGSSPQPMQLTSGPMGWCCNIPSRDGKTIFATGLTARGELVRFDARSRQLQSYMAGISAEFLSYSKDGRSVAYVTYPDGNLWRANGDGSGREQLSGAPAYPKGIRWSPDGAQLAFSDLAPSKDHDVIYSMPAQGGNATRITPTDDGSEYDPTWSQDGKMMAFFASRTNDLRIVDLASHQITALPGSAGLFSPRWSPDGRSIVAITADSSALKIFDLATQRWSTLLKHEESIGFPSWSHDSRYVYFLYPSDKPGIYRIRATGGDAERIVDLTEFHHTGTVSYWFGLDPTDAPLLLRDAGTEDIYALSLEAK